MIDATYTVKIEENENFLRWFSSKFREEEDDEGGISLGGGGFDDLDALFGEISSEGQDDSDDWFNSAYDPATGSYSLDGQDSDKDKGSLSVRFFDYIGYTGKAFFSVIVTVFKTFKNRTKEDVLLFIHNLKIASLILLLCVSVCVYLGIGDIILITYNLLIAFVLLFIFSIALEKLIPILESKVEEVFGSKDAITEEDEDDDMFDEDFELDGRDIDMQDVDDSLSNKLIVNADTSPEECLSHIESNSFQEDLLDPEYVYSMFKYCLHTNTLDFDEEKEITKDNVFYNILLERFYEGFSTVFSQNLDIDFDFVSVKETKFFIDIIVKNIRGVPKKALTDQRNIEAFGAMFLTEEDSLDISYVPITVREMADTTLFKIYKLEKPIITFGDLLQNERVRKDFFRKHSREVVPYLAGLVSDLTTLVLDLPSEGHILIVGATRSGKGWLTQFIIYSLSALNPPYKVSFLILDPKNEGSFRAAGMLPHVVKVESDYTKFFKALQCVRDEAEFRKGLFAKYDIENYSAYYNEYSKNGRVLELPYLVVVIDELVALGIKLGKEANEEFNGMLTQMASEYASFGIKFVFIAQIAKNDSIKKTITQQCTIKYAVRADKGLQDFTFDKPKASDLVDLTEPGDIGIKYNKGIMKIRQPTVSIDTENTKNAFRLLALSWTKNNVRMPKLEAFSSIDCRKENFKELKESLVTGNYGIFKPVRPGSILEGADEKIGNVTTFSNTDEDDEIINDTDIGNIIIDDIEDDNENEAIKLGDTEIKVMDDEATIEVVELDIFDDEEDEEDGEQETREDIDGIEDNTSIDDKDEPKENVDVVFHLDDELGSISGNSTITTEGMEDIGKDEDEDEEELSNNELDGSTETQDKVQVTVRRESITTNKTNQSKNENEIVHYVKKNGGRVDKEELLKRFCKSEIEMALWENKIVYDSKKEQYLI